MKTVMIGGLLLIAGAGAGAWAMHSRMSNPERVRDAFHILYHQRGAETYNNTHWLGTPTQQCPLDLWVFQEIMHETKPDVLVEAGTFKGGSAGYYAALFDAMGRGRVITIDIEKQPNLPVHPRITYLLGSSTSDEIVEKVKSLIKPGEKVMVILDSDHRRDHVYRELEKYNDIVTPGNYLIVQDTHFNGHPILPKFGPGPYEAVQDFLKTTDRFSVDRSREKLLMTFNPSGFLKRVK